MSRPLLESGVAAPDDVQALVRAVQGSDPLAVMLLALDLTRDRRHWSDASGSLVAVRSRVQGQGGPASRPALQEGLSLLVAAADHHRRDLDVARRSVGELAAALARARDVATELSVEPVPSAASRARARQELTALEATYRAVAGDLAGLFPTPGGPTRAQTTGGGGAARTMAANGPRADLGSRTSGSPWPGAGAAVLPMSSLAAALQGYRYRWSIQLPDHPARPDRPDLPDRPWPPTDRQTNAPDTASWGREPGDPGSGGTAGAESGGEGPGGVLDGWAASRTTGSGVPDWLAGLTGRSRSEATHPTDSASAVPFQAPAAAGIGAVGVGAAAATRHSRRAGASMPMPMVPMTPPAARDTSPARAELTARGTADEWLASDAPPTGSWR